MSDREMVRFTGALGTSLAARLELPSRTPVAYALFAHCFTCSKDTLAAVRISQALRERGIAVLRFDFTGLGGSEGEFANTNFSSNVSDIVAAAGWLRDRHEAPKLLIGHSLGGAAVLAAASQIAEATAIATIGAPYEPSHIERLFTSSRDAIEKSGEAEVAIGGRTFTIRKSFLEDVGKFVAESYLGSLGKALIVFHSPRDSTVNIENASRIFIAAKHPKSFVSLDTADHLLTKKEDAVYVAEVLAAWASRFVAATSEAKAVAEPAEGFVTVTESGEGTYAELITTGHHALRADEPAPIGTDTGPSPYDLLLAALGACTAMTVRVYAQHKKLPLERVSVRLRHSRVHAEDCAECETKQGMLDHIDREITVEGNLDASQRTRLLEIANRCPVHRTLESEIRVETRLAQ